MRMCSIRVHHIRGYPKGGNLIGVYPITGYLVRDYPTGGYSIRAYLTRDYSLFHRRLLNRLTLTVSTAQNIHTVHR